MMEQYIPYAPGFAPPSPDLPPHLRGPDVQVPFRLPAQARPPVVKPPKPPTATTANVKAAKAALANQGIDFAEIAKAAAAQYNIDPAKIDGLSDKEKYRMLTRMGISMMAASSRPGATTAESLAAGLTGYLGEEDRLKGEKAAAYKANEDRKNKGVDRALDIAKMQDTSNQASRRLAVYQRQIEDKAKQSRAPTYMYEKGTPYAVTGTSAVPVSKAGGVPLQIQNPAQQSAMLREAGKQFQILKQADYGGITTDDQKWAQAMKMVGLDQEQNNPMQPYGATPESYAIIHK